MPLSSACRKCSTAFTLVELLAVVAILAVLVALSFPVLGRIRDHMAEAKNISRMKAVATALLTGAADNNGFLPSSPSTRGRWPTAAHQYFGIRTDLDWKNWGQAAQINQSSYTAEVMRPAQLDSMRRAMLDGSRAIGPVGIWLVNNNLVWRGTSEAGGIAPKPLVSLVAPSKTPLVGMSSEDNGLGLVGQTIHTSATAQGFTGETSNSGPAPINKGRMFYAMCDGSVQIMSDFWPFQDPEWPEPWKAFHPLREDAPASDAP